MKINLQQIGLLLLSSGIVLTGCSGIGDSVSGASASDMKGTFDKLPIEQRAKMLLDLPGDKKAKEAKIKDMYQKEGKTPPADIWSLDKTALTK
jgi:hypothetical protein